MYILYTLVGEYLDQAVRLGNRWYTVIISTRNLQMGIYFACPYIRPSVQKTLILAKADPGIFSRRGPTLSFKLVNFQ